MQEEESEEEEEEEEEQENEEEDEEEEGDDQGGYSKDFKILLEQLTTAGIELRTVLTVKGEE